MTPTKYLISATFATLMFVSFWGGIYSVMGLPVIIGVLVGLFCGLVTPFFIK